jgi:hypothetical protein
MPSHTMLRSLRTTAHAMSCATVCVGIALLGACESSHMLSPSQAARATLNARAVVNCVVTFGAQHTVSSFLCGPPGQKPTTDMLAKASAKTALAPNAKTRAVLTNLTQVSLTFSTFVLDPVTHIFSFNTTVTNLLAQPIGTHDGVTPNDSGTRVVVTAGPTVATGTGTVTVIDDSGTMDLTAPGQPFWQYDAIIAPSATSPISNWKFQFSPLVTGIQFQVEVVAAVPSEESVLQWKVLRQGLTDSTMNGVWRDNSTDIYAVGGGAVLHYDGTTWSTVAAGVGPGTSLQSVFGFGPSDVWIVAKAFSSHFNGATWTPVTATGTLYSVWGSGTSDVYAVGTKILHNTTGTKWVTETDPLTSTLRSVWGSDPTHVWAVGDGGTILFNPGTGVWTAQTACTTANLRSVWGSSATNVYAVGMGGAACRFNGTTWSTVAVGTNKYLEAVGGSSASDVWIASPNGQMSHFNGTAWTQLPATVGATLLAVTSGSPSSVAVVGNFGTLLNYNGTTFPLSQQAGIPITGIWATDTNNIYASSFGTILHYNGTSWSTAYAGVSQQLNALSGTSNTDIYAAGAGGALSHFNGASWTPISLSGKFNGIWDIPNESTVYAVGAAGLIEKGTSPNKGSFTTQTPANAGANLKAVWAIDGGAIFIVDSAGNISHSDGTGTWTDEFAAGVPLYAINGLEGVDQLAVGGGGNAYRLTGTTWVSIPTSTTNTLRGVWDAFAFDVYAVGDGGVIQHWNGATWAAMGSPVTVPLNAIYGTAQAHIYVGGGNGVVLFGTR